MRSAKTIRAKKRLVDGLLARNKRFGFWLTAVVSRHGQVWWKNFAFVRIYYPCISGIRLHNCKDDRPPSRAPVVVSLRMVGTKAVPTQRPKLVFPLLS